MFFNSFAHFRIYAFAHLPFDYYRRDKSRRSTP